MKLTHAPRIDARYWTAITLASVFGTNLGDLYAHESGLGLIGGLGLLAALAAVVFTVERVENLRHQAYYWLAILILRTGATNIADYLAYRVRVPDVALTLGLIAVIAVFGFFTRGTETTGAGALPRTNAAYWIAMLGAGVFGTAEGDIADHILGEARGAILLTALLVVLLVALRKSAARNIAIYWTVIAVARTAGTAIGDWLAENHAINIGLAWATLVSGVAFTAVLLLWKSSSKIEAVTAE